MKTRVILVTLMILLSSNVKAVESDIRVGYLPSLVNLGVDDPNGSTNTASEVQYLGAMAIYEMSRNDRLYAYITLYDFELDAGQNKIGQEVESTSLAIYYQSNFKLSRSFKPWLGAGAVINIASYTNRYDTDIDGYLLNNYADRDDTSVSLGLSASKEWEFNDSFSWGLNLEYLVPIGDTLEGFTVGVSLIYD
ncbi:MAG: hypothetical protein GY820_35485 [Gammaproteobacteria bacterium]|nr:hypothetical protein [Gammaproteobacteria bacterium]